MFSRVKVITSVVIAILLFNTHALAATQFQTMHIKDILSTKKSAFSNAGAMTISTIAPMTHGVIGFLKIYFYADTSCSTTLLGEASVIDNGSGFVFNNGEKVYLNSSSAYKLANNKGITTGNIHCMSIFVNGSNYQSYGVSCNHFTPVTCSGTTCTSSTNNAVIWAPIPPNTSVPPVPSPTACSPPYTFGNPPAPSIYVGNYLGNNVTQCTINILGGLNCLLYNPATIDAPLDIGLNNGYAYIVNSNDTVSLCSVNPSNGALTCALTATPGYTPNHAAGAYMNTPYIYFTNAGTSQVFRCTVSASNGSLSACTPVGSTFDAPIDISISAGYAYVSNQGPAQNLSSISVCSVNTNTGAFSGCTVPSVTTNLDFFVGGGGLAISNGYLYAPNANGHVYYCKISSPGVISSCASTATGITLLIPSDIIINNGYAYVTDEVFNAFIWQCTVNADGTLTPCFPTGGDFDGPGSLDIY